MAKRKNNRLLIIVLLIIVVALIIAAGIKAKSKPKGLEVEVEKVQLRTLKETVSASGKVFPEKEVKISSDVSGEIQGLPPVQLYNLENDPKETTNLQAEHPALVAELIGTCRRIVEQGRSTPGPKQPNDGGRSWWPGLPWEEP